MRNIKLLTLLFALLLITVFIADSNFLQEKTQVNTSKETAKKTATPTNSPTQTPTPTEIIVIATTTPTIPEGRGGIDSFIYPESTIESREENELELKVYADIDQITNWYKERLKSIYSSINTFTQTSSSGKVMVKLVSVDSKSRISIDITRKQTDSEIEIRVGIR